MSSDYRYIDGRLQRPVVGSEEWRRAFPNGTINISTPLPPGTDLGQGYIPPIDTSSGYKNGNPFYDADGKPIPGSPADRSTP